MAGEVFTGLMRRSKPYIDDAPEPIPVDKKIGLPTLSSEPLPCNRCGECCKVGGECELRRIHPMQPGARFEGRCEFLTDLADGTTQCERMVGIEDAGWFKRLVDGNCDFPEMRVEVG